jgi:predicted N-acetyltransferase YhbS
LTGGFDPTSQPNLSASIRRIKVWLTVNKGELSIRDALSADGEAIRSVTLRAFDQYRAVMPEHWYLYRDNILATLADHSPAQQIVAEVDRKIVGAVLLYPAGFQEPVFDGLSRANPWPVVRLLAVPPEFRGRGIGRALMDECVRRAVDIGSSAIMLHSSDTMESAVGLYLRMGFVRDSGLDLQVAPDVIIAGYRREL